MKESVLISVIVPCYNCQDTVERCINSIFKQDYEHIEVIAIDDGSSDNTYIQLCKLAEQDQRLKIYAQDNKGPSAARNLGIAKAKGEYLAFVDSDDYVEHEIYVKMLESARKNDSDIVICNYNMVFADGRKVACKHALDSKYDSNYEVIHGVIRQFYDGDTTGLASLCNKLYRKKLFSQHAIAFDENLYRAEDWWVNLKLYEIVSKISTVNDCLYYYWQGNATSLMKRLELRLYYEWRAAKQYLTTRNQIYKFEINKNLYYRQLLLNVHGLLMALAKNKNDVYQITKDPFYNEIIAYDKDTSCIVRFVHVLHKWSIGVERIVYRILAHVYHVQM